jgi:hypothetical protein
MGWHKRYLAAFKRLPVPAKHRTTLQHRNSQPPPTPFLSLFQEYPKMSSLPSTEFTLTGGCFCNAIRYTITIPPLSFRPLVTKALEAKRPISPQTETTSRLPIIPLDHCNDCRRIAGQIIECWFICPQRWIQFSLRRVLPSDPPGSKLPLPSGPSPEFLSLEAGKAVRPGTEILQQTYLKYFSSSENTHRTFCGRCGTHISFHYSGEDDEMKKEENWGLHCDIAVGTMDRESLEVVRPTRHGWFGQGIGWVKELVTGGEWGFVEKEDGIE